tara:strand:+ start:237 stop:773 length:537 start_codon:yes stop_codon:yes gene_type:complete
MDKSFNKPDLKAPRYRKKVHHIINDDFYKRFFKKYPEYKEKKTSEIYQIIKSFNKYVCQEVINNRDGVELPESLGWIFIGTCKTNNENNIDLGKSIKYGIKVRNKNWETDGKLAKIFYSNYAPKYQFKHREYWKLDACRGFKRNVSKAYSDNWPIYMEIEPTKKVRALYDSNILNKDI